MSLPAWGEWIEIICINASLCISKCLSPHGESGLKSVYAETQIPPLRSLPAWGEWIEIIVAGFKFHAFIVSPRMGRVD